MALSVNDEFNTDESFLNDDLSKFMYQDDELDQLPLKKWTLYAMLSSRGSSVCDRDKRDAVTRAYNETVESCHENDKVFQPDNFVNPTEVVIVTLDSLMEKAVGIVEKITKDEDGNTLDITFLKDRGMLLPSGEGYYNSFENGSIMYETDEDGKKEGGFFLQHFDRSHKTKTPKLSVRKKKEERIKAGRQDLQIYTDVLCYLLRQEVKGKNPTELINSYVRMYGSSKEFEELKKKMGQNVKTVREIFNQLTTVPKDDMEDLIEHLNRDVDNMERDEKGFNELFAEEEGRDFNVLFAEEEGERGSIEDVVTDPPTDEELAEAARVLAGSELTDQNMDENMPDNLLRSMPARTGEGIAESPSLSEEAKDGQVIKELEELENIESRLDTVGEHLDQIGSLIRLDSAFDDDDDDADVHKLVKLGWVPVDTNLLNIKPKVFTVSKDNVTQTDDGGITVRVPLGWNTHNLVNPQKYCHPNADHNNDSCYSDDEYDGGKRQNKYKTLITQVSVLSDEQPEMVEYREYVHDTPQDPFEDLPRPQDDDLDGRNLQNSFSGTYQDFIASNNGELWNKATIVKYVEGDQLNRFLTDVQQWKLIRPGDIISVQDSKLAFQIPPDFDFARAESFRNYDAEYSRLFAKFQNIENVDIRDIPRGGEDLLSQFSRSDERRMRQFMALADALYAELTPISNCSFHGASVQEPRMERHCACAYDSDEEAINDSQFADILGIPHRSLVKERDGTWTAVDKNTDSYINEIIMNPDHIKCVSCMRDLIQCSGTAELTEEGERCTITPVVHEEGKAIRQHRLAFAEEYQKRDLDYPECSIVQVRSSKNEEQLTAWERDYFGMAAAGNIQTDDWPDGIYVFDGYRHDDKIEPVFKFIQSCIYLSTVALQSS